MRISEKMGNFGNFFDGYKKDVLLIAIILAVTILVYMNLFKVPFLYDDYDFLFHWESVKNFNHIPSLLAGETPAGHEGVYRPLRSIFYILSLNFFGHNIFYYHLQELFIYLLCVIFAYLITQKTFGRRALSFLTALIYALLPIHIDNVANLTASFDTIGVVFFLLSFLLFQLYLEADARQKNIWLFFSLAASFLAYTCYEITLVLPLFIFLYAFFKRKKLSFWVYFAYPALFFSYLFIRIGLLEITTRGSIMDSFPSKIISAIKDFIGYFVLTIFPVKLSEPTLFNQTGELTFSKAKEALDPQPILAQIPLFSAVLAGLIGIFYWASKSFLRRGASGFGLIWFMAGLIPAGIISMQSGVLTQTQTLWGKYAIIASIGIAVWLAACLIGLFKLHSRNIFLLYFKIIGITAIMALILMDAIITHKNLNNWQDVRPILAKQVMQEPESPEKHNDLGVIHAMYYRYWDAEKEFKKALALAPGYVRARQNLKNLCQIAEKLPEKTGKSPKTCADE